MARGTREESFVGFLYKKVSLVLKDFQRQIRLKGVLRGYGVNPDRPKEVNLLVVELLSYNPNDPFFIDMQSGMKIYIRENSLVSIGTAT